MGAVLLETDGGSEEGTSDVVLPLPFPFCMFFVSPLMAEFFSFGPYLYSIHTLQDVFSLHDPRYFFCLFS
jgi:hypothetical protein